MESKRLIKSPALWGWITGSTFDDSPSIENIPTAAIIRLVIGHGSRIDSLEIHRNDGSVPIRGGSGGRKDEFLLGTGEFITSIDATGPNSAAISSLRLSTNKGRNAEFGTRMTQGTVTWAAGAEVSGYRASRMGLLSFSGYAGTYIHALKPTFAEYPDTSLAPRVVRYESISTPSALTETHIAGTARNPAPLSKFALHLKAPVITLYAGPGHTEFHAYKDILCQLPFFRAALEGDFKEASEKKINMPEDDPGTLSALIEFLSTGAYTYPYDPETTRFKGGDTTVPIGDLDEGVFHVGVYGMASKYDCAALATSATNNVKEVLKEVEGTDVPRLWTAAYDEGLKISDIWGTGADLVGYKERLAKQVGLLFTEHPEEMEKIMSEYPALSCDLLRATTTPVKTA